MPNKILSVVIMLTLLASCNNDDDNNMTGGPCSYDEKVVPVMLVRLETADSLHYDALFTMADTSSIQRQDSIRYSYLENGRYLTTDEMAKDSIAIGKKYQYIIETIKTGSCDPTINRLVLKPYIEK